MQVIAWGGTWQLGKNSSLEHKAEVEVEPVLTVHMLSKPLVHRKHCFWLSLFVWFSY